MDEVAVPAVQFHPVEPGVGGPPGGLGEVGDGRPHLGGGEFARHGEVAVTGEREDPPGGPHR